MRHFHLIIRTRKQYIEFMIASIQRHYSDTIAAAKMVETNLPIEKFQAMIDK